MRLFIAQSGELGGDPTYHDAKQVYESVIHMRF